MSACGPGRSNTGPLMMPGENCLTCHALSGEAREKVYTAAGTVFEAPTSATDAGVSGVTVIITGADQQVQRLTTNAVGNFYTSKAIKAPFTVAVERNGKRTSMGSTPTGACASCHTDPPLNNAPGRIYAAP